VGDSAVLNANGIVKEFPTPDGALRVLSGIDLRVEAAESVAVIGPSGSGKSTLLHILGTLDRPTAGQLLILGQAPFDLAPRELARFRNRHIGFVFQEHYLLPQCTALENVLVPTIVSAEKDGTVLERAMALLDSVGLADRANHLPGELSGGERQRVAIVRALINRPELVLADEPTGNLDPRTAADVAELFVELCRKQQVALVVVTHNAELARRMDRVLRLEDGHLVAA